ncbi:16S rRNA (cytosine(1402)-N(4))-methyltransferase RsmH [Capnocytophaga catalasegens]|uniref:Ribosomal RNA small subunit methyltransferase H n=1 Tax=Capnocytophaga catalasegens TaxID=1004260 RepID=A0AAV5AZK1_9FLAO|nr:16S rRNA (cytosine(1402)-N(4))-methyltransferase RsmH [Capnocytophaga catalasegens]GIZ14182.1 ribosomal RNA small subunit methyltransferase H [Capnocytophaga catalasegens]GJM50362.1 ribosomal RNA small subunit methyltransferase H [Capnocytophaga catalasegens]GJM52644.1 ribosomal RNA small subunit methyltransferase H [Capnocytophaga catalasegens]
MQTNYHKSVLLQESVDGLNIQPDGVYVDVTFGGGGHSREILNRLNEKGRLIAFDQDKDAFNNAFDDSRFILIHQNFRYLKRYLRFYGFKQVDGVLGDFGVSSYQFDEPTRGFSTRFDGELDMRMNQDETTSAHTILNNYDQEALTDLFFKYGELKNARAIAHQIVSKRSEKEIKTTLQLQEILQKFLPKHKEFKVLAQIYQAIRIEVNDEIRVLEEFLLQLPEVVKQGGRISFISYHSLEDRLVKRFIRDGQFEGVPEKDFYGHINVPFKKVGNLITPSEIEIKENNRARSAKLRIGERL